MRQAIVTKYHGPTDLHGGRVSARADAGRVMVPWDHRLGIAENHIAAAQKLARKFGWNGNWYGGSLPLPNAAYAFVMADDVDFEVNEP